MNDGQTDYLTVEPSLPSAHPTVEVVERKGLGHPDTLAELAADEFIRRYTEYGLNNFGVVPNLNVDKLTLSGSLVELGIGHSEVVKRGSAVLIGKVTESVGAHSIPVADLLSETISHVFTAAGIRDLQEWFDCSVINNDRDTPDHAYSQYHPDSVARIRPKDLPVLATDTAAIVAEGPLSTIECLTIAIERALTSPEFRTTQPAIGTDIKVLTSKMGGAINVTVCVPVVATAIDTAADYISTIDAAKDRCAEAVQAFGLSVKLNVNTKDVGGHKYLTAFGTSLDKGDQGIVGRGSGPSGVRSISRWLGTDAIAGKNPFNHPAKIYYELASRVVNALWSEMGINSRAVLISTNGSPLKAPASMMVQVDDRCNDLGSIRERCFQQMHDLGDLESLSVELASRDPVSRFREGVELYSWPLLS